MEEIKLLAQFGVGGVLGGLMFYFYRQDHNRLTELHLQTVDALKENTAAVAALREALYAEKRVEAAR